MPESLTSLRVLAGLAPGPACWRSRPLPTRPPPQPDRLTCDRRGKMHSFSRVGGEWVGRAVLIRTYVQIGGQGDQVFLSAVISRKSSVIRKSVTPRRGRGRLRTRKEGAIRSARFARSIVRQRYRKARFRLYWPSITAPFVPFPLRWLRSRIIHSRAMHDSRGPPPKPRTRGPGIFSVAAALQPFPRRFCVPGRSFEAGLP